MRQNIKIIIYIFIITVLIYNKTQAQSFESLPVNIIVDNVKLKNGLMPGLIAPQFSAIDVNGDGKEDLFIFDRSGNVISIYINEGGPNETNYRYTRDYNQIFPQLHEFVLLRDYDGDGLKDIFSLSSENVPGVEVWKNVGTSGSPTFEKVRFGQYSHDILYFLTSNNQAVNLYVSNIDIPGIEDIDGDGDLDIITFETSGGRLHLYQNMVKEWNLPNDTLVYRLKDDCYGKIFESGISEDITLSDDPNVCPDGYWHGGSDSRHSGSTVTIFDNDDDGNVDLLIGDIGNDRIIMLENGGTSINGWMINQDFEFPSYAESALIDVFLSTFFLDVDNNGVKDLIITTNEDRGAESVNHIWYYKNVGTNSKPRFELQNKNFLMDSALNMGTFTDPCFIDYNGDGKTDLLVGNDGRLSKGEKLGGLYLFENTTEEQIEYTLVDDDYLDLAKFNDEKGKLSPTAGDMDGDGDIDLVIGNQLGYLFYFENIAGANKSVEFSQYDYPYFDIKPGSRVKPDIFDLNGDDKPDLIVGEKNDNFDEEKEIIGGINYYENIGTTYVPTFSNDDQDGNNTSALGGIYTKESGVTLYGSSAPKFFFDRNGVIKALVGSTGGKINLYDNISGNIYNSYTRVTDSIHIDILGQFSTLDLSDIDGDTFFEMVVGNERGGLSFYKTDFFDYLQVSTDIVTKDEFKIYPNPARSIIYLPSLSNINCDIRDVYGNVVLQVRNRLGSTVNIESLPQGIYIVEFIIDSKRYTDKIIKL